MNDEPGGRAPTEKWFGPEDLPVLERVWVPTWVFDPDRLVFHWANPSALELWGAASQEELLARDLSAMSETARIRARRMVTRLLRGETVIESWTFYPHGKPLTTRARASPFRHEDGRVGMLTEAIPLDTKFEAEELRALSSVRYLPATVTIHSTDGEVLVRNPHGVRTYGPLVEAAGSKLGDSWLDPAAQAQLRETIARRAPFHGEVEVHTLAGDAWHRIEVRPTTDPVTGEPTFIAIETDVSEARRSREALVRARDEAERATQARSFFLANMSHEIRTPLTSILGVVELMREGTSPREWRPQLDIVSESADILMRIVNDILDLTKIDAGELRLESMAIDLRAVVLSVVTSLQNQAGEKGIGLHTTLVEGVPAQVLGDPTRVRQILLNLVSNAVKFTNEGQVNVELGYEPEIEYVLLRVVDTGIGMSREKLDSIFAPFVQADSSTTRQYGGTGLGLAITRQLIELMRGRIEVDSEPGAGSRFSVHLPLPAVVIERHEPNKTEAMNPLRIVLAEDNPVNSTIISRWLRRHGHEVHEVGDGRAAVELVRQTPNVDVVLMDIQMPVMDGPEATRAIRQLGDDCAQLQIFALTADAMQSQVERYLAEGFDEYLTKPVDWQHLKTLLSRVAPRS